MSTAGFEPAMSCLLDWRSNILSYFGSDCRHLKVYDIHIPYFILEQVQSKTRNKIDFKFRYIIYRDLNVTVFSKRFPTINILVNICIIDSADFVSSSLKIVKRPDVESMTSIGRTTGLVLFPSVALCRSFLKHCTPPRNKALGTSCIWRDLSRPPRRRQGPGPRLLWLLVGTPSALGLNLASRWAEHSLLGRLSVYIFDILF